MTPVAIKDYTLSTALGLGRDENLMRLLQRHHGLRRCDFEKYALDTYIGCIDAVNDVVLPEVLSRFECRNNRLAYLALQQDDFIANVELLKQRYDNKRIAVVMGTTTSGFLDAEHHYQTRDMARDKIIKDFHYNQTANPFSIAEFVQAYLGLTGPASSIGTACSSSARAMIHAYRLIAADVCDAVIVGGADSLCGNTLSGFNALQLLSTQPARPCDGARDGLSVGEGAGFLLLERGDAELQFVGYGESCDAYHMSRPHPEGVGAKKSMRQALINAELQPKDVGYINMHGTASLANDVAEANAIYDVFGNVPCASTKGHTGHSLGAAGAIELVISCLALAHQQLFACANTQAVDDVIKANVLLANQSAALNYVMSNSFGFGGNNCSILLGKVK